MLTTQTIWVGDLLPNLVFAATSQPSNTPIDRTCSTCSVLFGPGTGNINSGFAEGGTGTVSENTYAYQLGSDDTATASLWIVQLEAVFPGSYAQHFSPQVVLIQPPVAT